MNKNYLPHIDALRGLAVLSVLIFHIDEALLPGGFIGVDMFFVISGFVITRGIKDATLAGEFRFSVFYINRFKRLFPTLFALILVVGVIASLISSPQFLSDYSSSSIAALFGVSNFYFWNEAGYFDTIASHKPLLHTWTLSVEEQFYLLLPLISVCLFKKSIRFSFYVFVILFLLSLFFSVGFSTGLFIFDDILSYFSVDMSGKDSSFYLPIFRFYEFLIGVLLSYVSISKTSTSKFAGTFSSVGLTLFLISLYVIDASLSYPSYYALLPCFASVFLILGGGFKDSIYFRRILIEIGKISYSVYLVHWPLIVFWKYIDPSLDWIDKVLIFLSSILVGYILYLTVEKRFRYSTFSITKKCILLVLLILYMLWVIGVQYSDGWKSRISYNANIDFVGEPADFHKTMYGGVNYPRYGVVDGSNENESVEANNIIIIGDSFARHYAYGINTVLGDVYDTLYVAAGTSCLYLPNIIRVDAGDKYANKCRNALNKATKIIQSSKAVPVVILSHAWLAQMARSDSLNVDTSRTNTGVDIDDILKGVKLFKDFVGVEIRLILIGELPKTNGYDLYDMLSRPRLIPYVYEPSDNLKIMGLSNDVIIFNERLGKYSRNNSLFDFFNPTDALCEYNKCANVDDQNRLIYSDSGGHLSIFGSLVIIKYFKKFIVNHFESGS
jgi:peptidoglycan/LPS O-acetylase OafA/YrhL